MSMHPAVSNGSYDVAKIRADFPALAMQVYGKPLVYLDNAASAQKPRVVIDAVVDHAWRRMRPRESLALGQHPSCRWTLRQPAEFFMSNRPRKRARHERTSSCGGPHSLALRRRLALPRLWR